MARKLKKHGMNTCRVSKGDKQYCQLIKPLYVDAVFRNSQNYRPKEHLTYSVYAQPKHW